MGNLRKELVLELIESYEENIRFDFEQIKFFEKRIMLSKREDTKKIMIEIVENFKKDIQQCQKKIRELL